MESTVLLAMAFDRYVAICHPLRHATVLTLPRVAKIGIAAVVRGTALMAPLPVFIKRLPFCRSNILSHSYCLHQDVMKLACADIRVNVIYGLIVIISAIGLDSLLISFSYLLILKTVLGLTREAQAKAHDSLLPVIMANIYLLIPPVLNPIVYGVKTKEIRQRSQEFYSIRQGKR
ncbi:olfactory receptor 51E1, partial [Sigmodon hispidus]